MSEQAWLAERFQEHAPHLRAVAYRMLASTTEAEDALQEAWLRASRAGTADVSNLGGWLTTVVARVCLDVLRSRKARREAEAPLEGMERVPSLQPDVQPEQEAMLADSVGLAMLVVLETLAPAERVAFVLHDMFDVPFTDIADIVGRTPDAARQLASRARRRVRGKVAESDPRHARQRTIIAAFLAASRQGNFDALLALLDPDAIVRADTVAMQMGARDHFVAAGSGPRPNATPSPHITDADMAELVRGAAEVAKSFAGRAQAAQPALIAGVPGLVWVQGGTPRVAFRFTFENDKIAGIDLIADPEQLRSVEVVE